jgi:thiol-disulfide isomerase/thioredoxin
VACLAALAVATATGLIWRARNGKMRAPRIPRAPRGSRALLAAPEASAERPAGVDAAHVRTAGNLAAEPRVTTAELGQPLGERATLVQFSSAFCAPCRATRRVLAEVAAMTPGVGHIEIDAESRLDLVRALGVLRTPTVLVLAADGRIAARASGQPRKADVIGALGLAIDSEALDTANVYSSGLETG